MNGMVERIRILLQANQLTPTQFADSIGVARPIVSHILSGRNKPSLEVVQRIIGAFPAISLPWLLSGSGDMLAVAALASTPVSAPAASRPTEPVAAPAPSVNQSASKATRPAPRSTAPKEPEAAVHRPEPDLFGVPAPPQFSPDLQSLSSLGPQDQSGAGTTVVSAAAPAAVVPAPAPAAAQPPAAATPAPPAVPPADVALASAFVEPGKIIRRIVIFYQDGTFTDYQPEPNP
jgi:transcriptional regulator with XRE-family HTH domain